MGIFSTLDGLLGRGTSQVITAGFAPGGRLSLTSGVPVTTSDVLSATIYYVPYLHDTLQLWDSQSSQWVTRRITTQSVALTSVAHPVSKGYDIFAYLATSGEMALETGPVWTGDTIRATDVLYTDGRVTKSGDKTRLLLGSIYTNAAGFTQDSGGAIGTSPTRYLANAYNKVPRSMFVGEGTDSWSYIGAFRQANASAVNQLNYMVSLPYEPVEADVQVLYSGDTSAALAVGIAHDSTTTSAADMAGTYATTGVQPAAVRASARFYPGVGRHYLAWVERAAGAGTMGWYGDAGTALVRSGLRGVVWA